MRRPGQQIIEAIDPCQLLEHATCQRFSVPCTAVSPQRAPRTPRGGPFDFPLCPSFPLWLISATNERRGRTPFFANARRKRGTAPFRELTRPERFGGAPGAELNRTTRNASADVVDATKLQKAHRLAY